MPANIPLLQQRHDLAQKESLLQSVKVAEGSQVPWVGFGSRAVSAFTEVQKLARVWLLALSQPWGLGLSPWAALAQLVTSSPSLTICARH